MGNYVARRIFATIPVMGVVAIIVFLMLRLSPGDPAAIIAGDHATSDEIAEIREHLGLDRPLLEQFIRWLGQLVSGDFGVSIYMEQPVLGLILERVEPTLALAISTMIFAIALAVPLGVIAAWRAGSWVDQTIMALSVLAFSVPVFLIGYGLVMGFSLALELLPVQGFVSISEDPIGFLQHILLPTVALGLVYTALLARITRATMLEVLQQDYIRTARATGAGQRNILFLHALKNAAVPIVTVIGIGIALLIGGAVVTETVFNLPGLGNLVVRAVLRRDYPVIQGALLVIAGIYVIINFTIDVLYVFVDPRVRHG